MFSMVSFQSNGEGIEHAGQKAAFFGLMFNAQLVDYFTSVEALKLAEAQLQTERTVTQATVQFDLAVAA